MGHKRHNVESSHPCTRALQKQKSEQKGPQPKDWRALARRIAKASPLKSRVVARELSSDWAVLGAAIEATQRRMQDETATGDEIRALPAMVSNRRRLLADLQVVAAEDEDPLVRLRGGNGDKPEPDTVEPVDREELLR